MAFNPKDEGLFDNPKMGFQATDGGSPILLKIYFNPKDEVSLLKLGFKVTDAGPLISVRRDYENCEVLYSADAISNANNIVSGLTKLRLNAPLTLSSYRDVGKIPADVSCVYGQLKTHPATYMLISGDKDFSTCLHRLRNLGYNILLEAFRTNFSSHLVSATPHFLPWMDICLGQMSDVGINGRAPTSAVNYSSPTTTKDDAHKKLLKFGNLTRSGCRRVHKIKKKLEKIPPTKLSLSRRFRF